MIDDLQGLPIVTAHADKRIGATLSTDEPDVARFALDCRIARELGAGLVVLHLWELPDGDRYLERNLDRLPALLDIAEEHGLTLAVETIPCTAGTPLDNVRRACERDPRCRVTLDTEFLAAHGQLDRAHELGDRIAHVHVKDFDPDRLEHEAAPLPAPRRGRARPRRLPRAAPLRRDRHARDVRRPGRRDDRRRPARGRHGVAP